jgi:hypothetical protein
LLFTAAGRSHRFLEPLLEVRKILELLTEVLEAHDPRPDRHVGDRIVTGDIRTIGQPLVQHTEQPVDLAV